MKLSNSRLLEGRLTRALLAALPALLWSRMFLPGILMGVRVIGVVMDESCLRWEELDDKIKIRQPRSFQPGPTFPLIGSTHYDLTK
jgi:hypothetical protein